MTANADPTPVLDVADITIQVPAQPLRKHFAWTLTGNLIYAGCQWGILVAIAKLGSPAMVGQFALGLAIAAPVFMLTNLQLRAVQATDARREYRFGHYLALRLAGTAVALLAVAAILQVAGYRRETALVVLAVALAKATESFSDVFYGLWQQRERFDRIARAMIGRGVSAVAALAVVLYLTGEVLHGVVAMAAVWAAWMLTYERGVSRQVLAAEPEKRLHPIWDAPSLKQLALLAGPLGVVMMLLSLNTNIPRYFIEGQLGEAALGYFSAVAYITVAGIMVVTALGQAAAPRLSRYYIEDREAFRSLLRKMLLMAMTLGLAGVLAALIVGGPILKLLYRSDYAEYASLFVWLMAVGATLYVGSMLGFAMTAARRFRAQVPVYGTATAVILVMSWLLIPSHGLLGGAWAVLTGAVASAVGAALVIQVALRTPAGGERFDR